MAVRKKTAILQHLDEIDVFIEDTGIVSEYFNITDIPSEIPIGKSSMLLMGSRYLKENVVIKVELLDNSGNAVYLEPVFDYTESGGVRISIEVYEDTPPGTATLTVLGELDPDKVDFAIPAEFIGVYNVKFSRPLTINKTIPNDRPIRFHRRPTILVSEIIKGQITPTAATTGSLQQTVGTVAGVPASNTEGNTFSIDSANYGEIPTYTDQVYGFNPIGNFDTFEVPDSAYTFTIENANFSSSMVGGTLTIDSPVANPSFLTSSQHLVTSYSARISKVINKKTIEVQKPFGIYNSGSGQYEISAMTLSSYSVNWPQESEFVSSSVNFKSFADVRLSNMRTFSGDVYRVSGYVKNNGPFGNWQKVIDTPIESPELLIDVLSMTGTTRIGYFKSDSVVSTYWNAKARKDGVESSTTLQTYSGDEYLSDSLFVSGSGADMLLDDSDEWISIELKPQYSMSFDANTDYTIRAKLVADNRTGSQNRIRAVAHMSGSAFGMSSNYGDIGYGRPIGVVNHTNSAGKIVGTNDQEFEAVFTPDSTGTAVLQIRFTGGYWHMSNLSIRPNSETNFSPEFIRLIAPVPPLQTRPDYLDFAFEFYDVNNNKSQTVVTTVPNNSDGVKFEGENLNIFGDDNTIAGSLFIGGDPIGSGIQMGGVTSNLPETGEPAGGSGFIRSVNYQGFTSSSLAAPHGPHTGWMIYSGSVLPSSGDDYAGVGLELAGESGSFRFGTNPSRFEVIADTFFVGNPSSQFISGSGGIIEISSSAFHLSSSGDVFVSGSITATSGYIGDWTISSGNIVGANITMDADGSRIYKTDSNAELTGYYMDFTPGSNYYVRFGTDFAVSSSGTLIAKGAIIEGVLTSSLGLIADWSISPGVISSVTSGKYTGMSTAGDTRFFAGAASLTASGSAPFNVKATGDITGSSVQFIGGSIGGFTLSSTEISSSGLLLKSSGQITGSQVLLTGGKIGGFNIDGDHFFDTAENLQLTGSTGNIVAKSGTIGGWELGASQLTGNNLILNSSGLIETSNFASGVKGWRISDTGEAEFENAHIRGTLSTVVFEKQSVNAVGGQLWIANSSAITASVVSNSDVTMSLVNASGFTADEYLIIKKVTPTGFNQEIVKIVSSSIDDTDTGAGKIMVTRGENSTTAVDYDEGQVVVSTGRVDTGYIRLNANPSDASTPYIDVVERTGSAYPDFALKARLGDLSGLSSGLVGSTPGFGLFSENVFLTGKITATSGEIGGFNIDSDHISDTAGNLQMTGSTGNIVAKSGTIAGWTINGTQISSSGMFLDSSTKRLIINSSTFGSSGIQLENNSGNPQFYVGDGVNDHLKYDSSGVDIKTTNFKLDTAKFDVDSTVGLLALGTSPTLTTGTGMFMSSSGEFRMGDADGNINFVDGSFNITGSDLSINVTQLNIDTPTFELSSPHVSMSLGANREILLDADGGTGGVPVIKVSGGEISSSNFFVSTAGNLTASNASFQGVISASEGNIAGWSIQTGSMERNDIRIQSEGVVGSDGSGGPGFYIADSYGNDVVTIVSGSLYEIGAATDEAKNDSFEVLQSGWDTDGYHVGDASSPLSIPSWSFSSTGPVSHSITKRTGTGFEKFNAAVVGEYTFDVIRPGSLAPIAALSASNALVSASYAVAKAAGTDENSYELIQIVSASSQASDTWIAGNVVSFAFVGKMSHSLAGAGYDRGLGSQKYKVDYWTGSEWKTFIPERTGSDGFGKFDLSARYTSVKASNQLPATTDLLRMVISGSINSDITFKSSTPIYEELELDPLFKYLKALGKVPDEIVEEERNVADDSAKYPYTELTFDNFRLIQDQPRIQISQAGFLLYQSENSYFRMTPSKIDMRSATDGGVAFGKSVTGNASMGGLGVRGRFAAPKLQAWDADPNTIEAYSFPGNTDEYARGNHAHLLPFDTVRDVLSGNALLNFTSTGIDDNATETAITIGSDEHVTFTGNIIISGTVDGRDVSVDGTKLDGIEAGANVTNTVNVTAAGALMDSEVDADIKTLALPASTTISTFGATLIEDANASTARTTLGLGSVAVLSTIDISGNTNLAASTGITLTGDTLTTNDGQIVHDSLSGFVTDEHINHANVSVIAGAGMTGGGAIDSSKTLNVIGGTGITVNADDVALATGHSRNVDHGAVSVTAGSGLTGGGTIAATRTINIAAAQTTITSIYKPDVRIGEDAQTRLDFSEPNKIRWYAGNQLQMQLEDGVFKPASDSDVDFGTTGVRWKDAYVDSITVTGAGIFGGTLSSGTQYIEANGLALNFDTPSSGQNCWVTWNDDGTAKWEIGKNTVNKLYIHNYATGASALEFDASSNAVFGGTLSASGYNDSNWNTAYTHSQVTGGVHATGTVTSVATGGGLTGGTITTSGTLSHADTSSQGSVDNSGRTFVQDITLDTYGHITGITSATDADTYVGTVTSVTGGTGITSSGGTTPSISITADSVGDTQLAYNTGQHLTTTSTVQFGAFTAGTISNTGLHTVNQTADDDGIRFRGYDNESSRYGKIGLIDGGYLQMFAEGDRSIKLKSGRQIQFFTSADNSTYVNSVNFNSDGSVTFTGVVTWSGGGSANANTAYTHSQIAGGNSVHVSTTENTNWDTAYTYSQVGHLPLAGGTMGGAINFNNQDMTLVDIDTGDIATAVVINKSPVVNFNSGDVQGSITLTNLASGTGGLTIQATSVEGSMLNNNIISGQGALGSATVAQADLLLIDDGPGTIKKVTFSNFEDSLYNNISGDILIAAGGAVTIQANSVALTTDTTGNYVKKIVSSTGLSGGVDSEGATATLSVDASQTQVTAVGTLTTGTWNASDIALGTYTSGNYVGTLTGGTGITSTGATTGEGIAHSISVDASQTQITAVGTLTTGTWNASDIALGTYTSGNYVGTLAVGAGMAAVNADGEGSSKTIAVDGVLEDLDALAAVVDAQFIVGTGAGTFGYESTTTARTSLGVGEGDAPSFAGLTSTEDIILDGTGDSIYNTFVTGMFGTGWQIDYGSTGSTLEIDNIVVRNTLRTHIFQKDTVKASNGALYISDSGVIHDFSGTTGTGTVSFKDDKSASFVSGSILWYKDANPDTGTISSVKFGITDGGTADTPVDDATQYTVIIDAVGGYGDLSNLVTGGTAVRITGGSLLLDASSTGAPFMDVLDDTGGIRVRIGQVKQEADYDKYGILGLDGSGNRVFEISEQRNEIAGWAITTDAISKTNISLNATIPSLRVTDGSTERIRVGDLNGVGGYSSAKYGVIGFKAGGTAVTDVLFELSNERNIIAGWTLAPGTITGGVVTIDATGFIGLTAGSYGATGIFIDGVSSARQSWVGTHGKMLWTGTQLQVYGNAGATKVFETTDSGATIGGWDLTATTISGGATTIHNTGYIGLTATDYNNTTGIFIDGTTGNNRQSWVGTHGKMVWTGTQLQIYGNAGSTKVFETTDSGAMIGGWNVSDTAIWSGTGPDTTDYTAAAGDMTISSTGAIHAYKFRIEAGGNAYFKGDITGASGTIGDVVLDSNGLHSATGSPVAYSLTSSGLVINSGTITLGDAVLNSTGLTINGTGSSINLGSGAFIASGAGAVTCLNLTAKTGGSIAGWTMSDESLSKNNVSLIQSVAKTGLDITDGTDSILTVAATSGGLSDPAVLAAGVEGSGGTVPDDRLDLEFELGTDHDLVNAAGKWVQDVTPTWPGALYWKKDATYGEVNTRAAVIPPAGSITTYGTQYSSKLHRTWASDTGVLVSIIASIKSIDWKFYGDDAKVAAYVEMIVTGDSQENMGDDPTVVFSDRIDYRTSKLVKIGPTFKNTYDWLKVEFNAYVTADVAGKAPSVTVGGFAVDGFYHSGITAPLKTDASGGVKPRVKPLVELTQAGLLIYSSKDEYMTIDDEGFTLKGPITATSMDVEGNASVAGNIDALGTLTISGSMRVQDGIAIGFGTDTPESKVHVKEDFTGAAGLEKFFIGEDPGWLTGVSGSAATVRATLIPHAAQIPAYGWHSQAAFASTPIHDTYAMKNCIVRGDLYTGVDGWAPATHAMSSSIDLGKSTTWLSGKTHEGLVIYQAFGTSNTEQGECRFGGVSVVHGYDDQVHNMSDTWGSNPWHHKGYSYVKRGTYTANPDNFATGVRLGDDSAYYAANATDGAEGPEGGYGLFLDGDDWKHYLGGSVGIMQTTPAFTLDVTGDIRATANITAYSDVRDKTNIVQITGAVDMLNAIRGVRFDWKDAYKKKRTNIMATKTGRLDRRQIGVIAQEVEKVLPELVVEDKDGRKNMSYANLTAVLVEAVKEQSEQIENLKERIKKLENE